MKIQLLTMKSGMHFLKDDPGLGYIGGYLSSKGHNIQMIQMDDIDECINESKRFQPEIIGISTYDEYFEKQIDFINRLKQQFPNIIICLGGYTATYHGRDIMEQYQKVDYIIVGEGEVAFEKLVNAISLGQGYNEICGLLYRENDEVVFNQGSHLLDDLDVLPFSNRDLMVQNNSNIVHISTSRGCTGNCTFCCSSDFWRKDGCRVYRKMSTKRIVDEIEFIYKKYGSNKFFFTDNSFEDPDMNPEKQMELANEIMKRNLHINYDVCYKVEFFKNVTSEFMDLMISSGLNSIYLGIESGNQDDLVLYNKRSTVEDNIKAMEVFGGYNDLATFIGFINLNPFTTIDRLSANINFLECCNYACDIRKLTNKYKPYKGTRLCDILENNLLIDKRAYNYTYKYINPDIEKLDIFINSFVHNNNFLKDSNYLCYKLDGAYIELKRMSVYFGESEAISIINDVREQHKNILMLLNKDIAFWFKVLLELLNKSWDNEEAANQTEVIYKERNLFNKYNNILINRNKLYRKLIKINNKFQKYLYY